MARKYPAFDAHPRGDHDMVIPDISWRPVISLRDVDIGSFAMPLQHLHALRSLAFYAVESENPNLRHYAKSEKRKSKSQF